nr:BBE domain-containing protein [Flexivirga aerilata]
MAPASRAIPHRDSVVKVQYSVSWADPADDAIHLDWIRRLYRDVFASTGGVPVPDAVSDGAYINYPDTDLADATWNTSAVAWSHLYYKDNYRRLQKVKRAHDPLDIFHHALSVRPR